MSMREPTTAWDRNPTDHELNIFYGNIPTNAEVDWAIERHAEALDANDLTDVCSDYPVEILAAIKAKNTEALMLIFTTELKATVARAASVGVYGDAFIIKASEVTL